MPGSIHGVARTMRAAGDPARTPRAKKLGEFSNPSDPFEHMHRETLEPLEQPTMNLTTFALATTLATSTILFATPAFAEEPAGASVDANVAPAPTVTLRLTPQQVLVAAALVDAEPPPVLASPAPGTKERPTTVFGLPENVGPVDRVIRGVVAAGLVGLASYGAASKDFAPATSGVLFGVSAIPALTAITGYCPLYQALGVDRSF